MTTRLSKRARPAIPQVVIFTLAREPAGWFITAPQRAGPFPSRGEVAAAAETLASWVRADGEDAQVVYASSVY